MTNSGPARSPRPRSSRPARVGSRRVMFFCGLWLVGLVAGWAVTSTAQERVPVNPPTEQAAAEEQPLVEADSRIPTQNLMLILWEGGVLMIPIIGCSFILVAFVFERAISLRRSQVIPGPFVKRFLHQLREGQLDAEQALALCEENGSVVANVFAAAIRKWGRPAVEVEQAILDSGERAANGLRKYLRIINGVATVSPLLGLLGTVVGMISAFNAIATGGAMGRPELLASGISEALITTAAGLSVAIPALIFYMFFLGRVDKLVIEIDALGQEVVSVIAADGDTVATSTRRAPRSRRESAA